MKIAGKTITGVNIETCVIPRGDNDYIVFKAQAVLDMDDFDRICPIPKGRTKKLPGGKVVEDIESRDYKARIEEYNKKRIAYMIIKSLEATEDLEWETVSLSDPSTWELYEKEFRDSGFSEIEIMRIINAVMSANCLNETKIEQARNDFLLSQSLKAEALSSQREEQDSTESGKLVNA